VAKQFFLPWPIQPSGPNLLRRGAVSPLQGIESGEEITVALFAANSLFRVLSLPFTGNVRSLLITAVAFTRVEHGRGTGPSGASGDRRTPSVGLLRLQGLSSRIPPEPNR